MLDTTLEISDGNVECCQCKIAVWWVDFGSVGMFKKVGEREYID